MKRALLVAAAATLAASLSACSSLGMASMGDGPMAGMPMPSAPSPETASYLRSAAEGDIYEVTSSQIALQRTQNPELRNYANKLIDHHTVTTNTTLTAAKAGGVAPPPAILSPAKRALIAQLNGQTGAAFDRLYMQQQIPAHEEALALHTGYAQSGDVGALRGSANAAVPIVQAHLNEARAMQTAMGGM